MAEGSLVTKEVRVLFTAQTEKIQQAAAQVARTVDELKAKLNESTQAAQTEAAAVQQSVDSIQREMEQSTAPVQAAQEAIQHQMEQTARAAQEEAQAVQTTAQTVQQAAQGITDPVEQAAQEMSSSLSEAFQTAADIIDRHISALEVRLRRGAAPVQAIQAAQAALTRELLQAGSAYGSASAEMEFFQGAARGASEELNAMAKRAAGQAAPAVKQVGQAAAGSVHPLNRVADQIRRLGMASFALRGLGAAFGAIRGVAQQYISTNQQAKAAVDALKSAFADALAPAANLVLNALSALLPVVQAVGNGFATLVTNLFGSGWTILSDGASTAADAVNNAADAQQRMNRELYGFDRITKASDKSVGGGGTSEETVGGGEGVLGQFSQLAGVLDQVKNAWENADFTDIGTAIGTKLKNALDSIPWDGIREKGEKIATSFATLLNGFFRTEGLGESVGKTISEALNTAFDTVNTFLEKFDFSSYGSFVGEAIQSAFASFDWGSLTRTASNLVKGALDFGTGLISAIDWRSVPEDIANAIKQAFEGGGYKGILNSAGELFKAAFKAAIQLTIGVGDVIGDLLGDIKAYFEDHVAEARAAGGTVGDGILSGISDAITQAVKSDAFAFADLLSLMMPGSVLTTFVEGLKIAELFRNQFTSGFNLQSILETAITSVKSFIQEAYAAFQAFFDWLKDWKLTFSWENGFELTPPDKPLSVYVEARIQALKDEVDPAQKQIGNIKAILKTRDDRAVNGPVSMSANFTKRLLSSDVSGPVKNMEAWLINRKLGENVTKEVSLNANLNDRYLSSKVISAVPLKAKFKSRDIADLDKTINTKANFTSRSIPEKKKDALTRINTTAVFTWQNTDKLTKTIKGYKAQIDTFVDNINPERYPDNKKLFNFTAEIKDFVDAIPKSGKSLSGFTLYEDPNHKDRGQIDSSIYRHAKGGIITDAMLFGNHLVGESGAEAIIPLEHNTEWIDRVAERLGQRQQTVIEVHVGDERLVRKVVDGVNDVTRRTGTCPIYV